MVTISTGYLESCLKKKKVINGKIVNVRMNLCADFVCKFCVQISCAFVIVMQKGMVNW